MSELKKEQDRLIVKPTQDIVSSNAEELKAELRQALDEHAGPLVIDLAEVKMIDSMGLGVLIATHNSLHKRDLGLEIINVSEEIARLFSAMRLDTHFTIV